MVADMGSVGQGGLTQGVGASATPGPGTHIIILVVIIVFLIMIMIIIFNIVIIRDFDIISNFLILCYLFNN